MHAKSLGSPAAAMILAATATWRNRRADSATVWEDGWRRDILVGLVESREGEQILRNLVPVAEDLLRPTGGAGVVAARP